MYRNQNRNRSRDNYGNNNRNRQRNNDNRRRDDFDRNNDMYQNQRNFQGGQMSQMNRGSFGMNTGGYSQGMNMGMYGSGQNQMSGFGGGYGGFQQQNRFGMNTQQMISPWAGNMINQSGATTGDEASLAMNILNAVLSSGGPETSNRGMSPPPNKMRRMDYRDGGYDDRRRRARSPPGRSHQNRQQSSQRGSDRRGRDGRSSSQRNDDKFRNSFSKSPGVSKSSRQSSVDDSSEFMFRKRLSYEEREREIKKFKDLPVKALKCLMCEKSIFHNVMAYLSHVDSKGHNKVAKAYHEKLAATGNLMKQNARLALQKEMKKAKAQGLKVSEKECRVCEGPMVYGIMKHKNILACKILHKYLSEVECCGKDFKSRSLVEEHCLSLAHLKAKYELETPEEEKDASEGEKGTTTEELVEDEEENKKRMERNEARRKRKFGDDETDEDEEEEEEEKPNSDQQDEKQEGDQNKTEKDVADSEQVNGDDVTEEKNGEEEPMETERNEEDQEENDEQNKESKEDEMETDQKKDDDSEKVNDEAEKGKNDENKNMATDKKDNKGNDEKGNYRKRDNKSKLRKDKESKYNGKSLPQLTFLELLEFHKKSTVDDPENLTVYDPAQPTGLNYIDTRVSYHCMACLEYCPAFPEDLTAHSCSKEHYDLFRNKYMKFKGVRDSPTNLKKLKELAKKKEESKAEKENSKDTKREEDDNDEDEESVDVTERITKEKESNEEVAGDDALYDPYEGESGDLTTMLQEKQSTGKKEISKKIQDGANESETVNYEDNILDYEEDVVEDEDIEEKDQGEESEEKQGENEDNNENQDDDNFEGGDDNANEEDDDNEDDGDENEVEGNEYEEDEDENENEDQEFKDNEEDVEEQVEDEEQQEEEEEEVEEIPQPPVRRGRRSRRAF